MVAKKEDKKIEVTLDTTKTKKVASKSATEKKSKKEDIAVEVKKTPAKAKKDDKEVISDLSQIKDAVAEKNIELSGDDANNGATANVGAKVYTVKKDKFGRAYATGKRKDAVARVWIKSGKGDIIVNDKPMNEYFKRPVLQMIVGQPFGITKRVGSFDVLATVSGGGLSGQAGAVKHGISKAICNFEPELRSVLKKAGFLTRDARTVERKKFGHAKARRSFQFSKR